MGAPVLHVFSISHYCEKARWAMDYLGLDYRLSRLAPGGHIRKAKSLGLDRGSLPILQTPDETIQGSAHVVSWAETQSPGNRRLSTPENREACLQLESRLDDVAGIHVRRYFYSEAMVDYPATVQPIFRHGLSAVDQIKVRLGWNMIRRLMIKGMDLGPAQREDSREILAAELDWLDGLLSDGRRFLVGDSLTRADIAAASLLAPIALPEEHPEYQQIVLPPLAKAETASWANRPSIRYVGDIYRAFRN